MRYRGLGAFLLALPLSAAGLALSAEGREASANSAPPYWEGSDGIGAILTGDRCPIEVEREHLRFSLAELPKLSVEYDLEEFQRYSGKFTAEYTFFNPTESEHRLKLVFPLGGLPSYYPYGAETLDRTTLGYAIEQDGERVDFGIRHTLNDRAAGDCDLEEGIARLYPSDRSLYRDDLPVTVYRYRVEVQKQAERDRVNFALSFNASAERTRVFCSDYCNYSVKNGKAKLTHNYDCAEAGTLDFTVYVVGEDITEPENGVYRYEKGEIKADGGASISLVNTERGLTFSELALSFRTKGSPVSDADWINAFIDYIEENKNDNSCYSNIRPSMFGSDLDFMEWFEYSLTIPAGGRTVNRVSAPIYPSVDGSFRQDLYCYTYLLSPAQKWARFGQLTIDIDTPYYISDSSLDFEKRSGGYTLTRDKLPLGELTFTLSEEERETAGDRDLSYEDGDRPLIIAIVIVCTIAAGAAAVIILLAVQSKHRRKRREEEEKKLLQARPQEGKIDLPEPPEEGDGHKSP